MELPPAETLVVRHGALDDIQLHVAEVKAMARELWTHLDEVPQGADESYEAWNERSCLVALMQKCIVEHLKKVEGEILGLRRAVA